MRHIHYLDSADLVYINNAKAACSTIKATLWAAHDRATGVRTYTGDSYTGTNPFIRGWPAIEHINEHTKVFSVVRNPYRRLLSAYLDKILPAQPHDRHWKAFVSRYQWERSSPPTFEQALACYASDDPSRINAHFRLQTENIMTGWIAHDHIGYVEDLAATVSILSGWMPNIHLTNESAHATGASGLLDDFLSRKAQDIILDGWADDFETFGYSPNPEMQTAQTPEIKPPNPALFEAIERTKAGSAPEGYWQSIEPGFKAEVDQYLAAGGQELESLE